MARWTDKYDDELDEEMGDLDLDSDSDDDSDDDFYFFSSSSSSSEEECVKVTNKGKKKKQTESGRTEKRNEETMPRYDTKNKKGLLILIQKVDGAETGTKADRRLALSFFRDKLHFDVQEFNGKSFKEFLNSMQRYVAKNAEKYYCLVLIFSCHGNKKTINVGGETLPIKKVTEMFGNSKLQSFSGRPKVIIIDACRGNDGESTVKRVKQQLVAKSTPTSDSDILIVNATTKGKVAYCLEDGSVLHKCLVETLNEYWKRSHLEEMLIIAKNKVNKWKQYTEEDELIRQTAHHGSTLTKLLYLQ